MQALSPDKQNKRLINKNNINVRALDYTKCYTSSIAINEQIEKKQEINLKHHATKYDDVVSINNT